MGDPDVLREAFRPPEPKWKWKLACVIMFILVWYFFL